MRTQDELKADLSSLALPLFNEAGVDLIELNVRKHGAEVVIQVLTDFPSGGISLEQCSLLNRTLVDAIDRHHVIDGEYTVELSSPGLDRPLSTRKDFLRCLNKEIRFVLKLPVAGKREHTGILKEVREDAVCVDTERYGDVIIPIGHILKAVQVF
jgi:ribosome maturation factor RimP